MPKYIAIYGLGLLLRLLLGLVMSLGLSSIWFKPTTAQSIATTLKILYIDKTSLPDTLDYIDLMTMLTLRDLIELSKKNAWVDT
jgi:hypothetical protein